MKVSAKIMYAGRVMAQLGQWQGRVEMPHIEELAKAEAVPANYLVQILNDLRTAGLIVSRRGKQGGYALAREPEEIDLLAVVNAVDGGFLEVVEGEGQNGERVSGLWRELVRGFEERLRAVTVRDLMTRAEAGMYYI